jgi:hypothetical protein
MTDYKKVIMNEDEYAAELKRLQAKADDLVAEYKGLLRRSSTDLSSQAVS